MTKSSVPQSLKASTIWTELKEYFKDAFDALPGDNKISFTLTRSELIKTFKKRFKNKYDPEEIADLLKNGFEVEPGIYLFKFKDFAPVKRGAYDI